MCQVRYKSRDSAASGDESLLSLSSRVFSVSSAEYLVHTLHLYQSSVFERFEPFESLSMVGRKSKLDKLANNVSSTQKSRPSPSITASEPILDTSWSSLERQDAGTATRNAASAPLESLPVEILLRIFAWCRNPYLSNVSSRLHRILPPFQTLTKSLAGYAMAALPWADNYDPATRPMLHQLPICEVVDELYASPWVDCPKYFQDHLDLQQDVFHSRWFGEHHFTATHFSTYRRMLSKMLLEDGYFMSTASSSFMVPQRFSISIAQRVRIQRRIKSPSPRLTPSSGYIDLNLRTKHVTSQAMQIDIQTNEIRFRKGSTADEVYFVSAINHVPSFVYDPQIFGDIWDTVDFITGYGRDTGQWDRDTSQFDPIMNDRERRLFGSIDGVRDMCNRIIDNIFPPSNRTGDQMLRELMSIDEACFVDSRQPGAVDFDMYRRAAFSNDMGYLQIVFEQIERACEQTYEYSNILNQQKSFALFEPDLFTALKKDLLEDQDDHSHVLECVEVHIREAQSFVAREHRMAGWYCRRREIGEASRIRHRKLLGLPD